MELMVLDNKAVAGIHVRGGTIIKTTNKGNPMNYPVVQADGSVEQVDITDHLIERIRSLGVHAVISIGGDGSQRISQHLHQKGLPIIGVPKTIDNDLAATDFTFGFQTAVQIATESFDKLVTTAESHHRVIIMEVMGRSAGWIALHASIAGGAEVCLIPEIPYDIAKVAERINNRYSNGKGFAHIVVAEGAKPANGTITARKSEMLGYENLRLGGVAYQLSQQLRDAGCTAEIRETVLGHLQRGGTPSAFDRVLATLFGVKAFEMVLAGQFGQMVAYKHNSIVTVPIEEAVANYKVVDVDSYVMQAARGVGVSFGD
jgi:6-phosphofructokinase 1